MFFWGRSGSNDEQEMVITRCQAKEWLRSRAENILCCALNARVFVLRGSPFFFSFSEVRSVYLRLGICQCCV